MRFAAVAALLLARPLAVVAQSSFATTPSSTSASSTASSTGSASNSTIKTTIALPPLYQCAQSTWTYTAPPGPKYLGVYVSGQSSWIETYALPAVYDDRTSGTFSWTCDLPAGLSVAFQFYVVQEGASGTNGNQASTPDALVNAGSSGDSCLGSNGDSGSQSTIISLASSLDPSYTHTSGGSSPSSSSSSPGSGGDGNSSNIGAIVGGVVGGVCGIAIVALLLIYLKTKHDDTNANNADGLSMYSDMRSEKRGSMHQSRYGGGPASSSGMNPPPPGTYYSILMMGYPPHEGEEPFSPAASAPEPSVLGVPASPAPKQTAAPGMLPEPMDETESLAPKRTAAPGMLPEPMDDSIAIPAPVASTSPSSAVPPAPSRSTTGVSDYATPLATPSQFTPRTERDAYLGHHGLDDPASFSPNRQRG
ncbi:hypothetical protein JCM10213v2_001018 [Rhodosporidiobolus nylandii]